jgi:hypothetical protein
MGVLFYQEKIINGVLSYRRQPQDGWTPMTAQELTEKIDTLLAAFLKESENIEKDLRKIQTDEIMNAKKAILVEEHKRIDAILDQADLLQDAPDPYTVSWLESVPRVVLCRIVAREVTRWIKEKVMYV